jgi:hypothetical protein
VVGMATKSMLKNVRINDKQLAKGLAAALSNAENKSSKDVVLRRKLEEVKPSDVKAFFEAQ